MQLEHEPESEDDDGRDLDELVEEPQEHERRDPGPRDTARGSAPRTAAMAPDAPIIGTVEAGSIATWVRPATAPPPR